MTKTKMTLSDVYTQPYYRSIITLLRFFDEVSGLTQTQIRYALQEDLEMTNIAKQKMKRYYGKELEKLFKISDDNESKGLPREIYRDCIKKGSHLSYYLNKLVEYNVIKKHKNDNGHPSYVIKTINYNVFWDVKPTLSQIKDTSEKLLTRRIDKLVDAMNNAIGDLFDDIIDEIEMILRLAPPIYNELMIEKQALLKIIDNYKEVILHISERARNDTYKQRFIVSETSSIEWDFRKDYMQSIINIMGKYQLIPFESPFIGEMMKKRMMKKNR